MSKNFFDEKKIKEIKEKLDIEERFVVSLPEMFSHIDIDIDEPKISRWLSYLLYPDYFPFGMNFINILLKCAGYEEEVSKKEVKVFSEYLLNKNDKIDILVETASYIIGIEFKLSANESNDQTKRYHKALTKINEDKNKKLVEIYLKPFHNKSKHSSQDFKIIFFKDIIPELRLLSDELSIGRDKFILDEFIYYIDTEQERNKNTSNISKDNIDDMKKWNNQLFEMFKDSLEKHDTDLVPILGNNKKALPCTKFREYLNDGFGFLVLARKTSAQEWENNGFHFEILWKGSFCLALVDKVSIEIHNEYRKTKTMEMDTPRVIYDKMLLVDFTSLEKASESIERIVEVLETQPFKIWGNRADECIRCVNK